MPLEVKEKLFEKKFYMILLCQKAILMFNGMRILSAPESVESRSLVTEAVSML